MVFWLLLPLKSVAMRSSKIRSDAFSWFWTEDGNPDSWIRGIHKHNEVVMSVAALHFKTSAALLMKDRAHTITQSKQQPGAADK